MSTRLLQAGVDHRIRLKRTRVDGMQTALLELKRQLKSAAQKEQRQQTKLQSMALDDSVAASLWEAIEGRGGSDGAAPSAAAPPPPPPPPLSGLAGREAVLRQSKQLRWRCHELQALEEKVGDLRHELKVKERQRRRDDASIQ